jgi:hypothetical protein
VNSEEDDVHLAYLGPVPETTLLNWGQPPAKRCQQRDIAIYCCFKELEGGQ